MQTILILFSALGLFGCFGATLSLNLSRRGGRGGRRLSRPRSVALGRERVA